MPSQVETNDDVLPKCTAKWTNTELLKLGVEYEYDSVCQLPFGDNDMPLRLQQGIEGYCKRIKSLDMQVITESRGSMAIMKMLHTLSLRFFEHAYIALSSFLKSLQLKNDPPTRHSFEPEMYNVVALRFIEATCLTISAYLEDLDWINPQAKAFLAPHPCGGTKIRLGYQWRVHAFDSGGVSLYYRSTPSNDSQRIVLSIQTAQKKPVPEDAGDTAKSNAAQAFAQILAQICHSEYFTKLDNEFQEAYVIQVQSTEVKIFYARLPNVYLSRVAHFGVHYQASFVQTVQLVQSRPFSLTKSEDQAAFYALLCKILWYLSSGRSHVGFLCDCPENKLFCAKDTVADVDDNEIGEDMAEVE